MNNISMARNTAMQNWQYFWPIFQLSRVVPYESGSIPDNAYIEGKMVRNTAEMLRDAAKMVRNAAKMVLNAAVFIWQCSGLLK